MQADGGIVVAGDFTSLGGVARNKVARLNADGTLDTGFNPNASIRAYGSAVQSDGRIVISGEFTTVGGVTRNRIARLNTDGTLDSAFNPNASDIINAVAVQTDGKIIIVGAFTTVGGVGRNRIARLTSSGALDSTFNPNANNMVYSAAIQTDGKIVVAGAFSTMAGVAHNCIARLNADGTLDTGFAPSVTGAAVYTISLPPDGRIVIGGQFTSVGAVGRNNVARLNADGSLDAGFDPDVSPDVSGMVLQADGKIVIGGHFGMVGGVTRNFAARLNGDGTVDSGFDPNSSSTVLGVTLRPDGKIMMGGNFTSVGGVSRNRIARLDNDPATQSLTVPSASRVEWLRGGSTPEAQAVSFELTTNSGGAWTSLGSGMRIADGWELSGLSLPASGHIRARARIPCGIYNGSSSLCEAVMAFGGAVSLPEIAVEQPAGTNIADGGSKDFGSVSVGGSKSLDFTIKNTGTADLTGLTITTNGTNAADFTVTANATAPVSGPSGSTTFSVSFAPGAAGSRSAAIHIASNDSNESPFDIVLTGTGVLPEIAVEQPAGTNIPDGGSKDFGSVSVGSNTSLSFTIKNTGGANLTLGTNALDGTNSADFTVTSTPTSPVSPGGSATMSVGFAPSGSGTRTATVHITNNDPDENPFDLTLTGTGLPNSNADLASLYAGVLGLSPAFNSSTTSYTLGVINTVTSITFTPTPSISYAAVTINGVPVTSGSSSSPISLALGSNVIPIVVTAQDGVTIKTYTVTVTRAPPSTGDVDTSFNPNVSSFTYATALQPDGKTIIGGFFTSAGGLSRQYVARLNSDGTGDPEFDIGSAGWTYDAVVQPDGKIVIGGFFTSIGGVTRNRMARVNSDGTLDTEYNPNVGGSYPYCLVMQSDGKVVVGGIISTLGGVTRNLIARVNADGTLDTGYDPNLGGGALYSMALQPDGRVVIGGGFTTVGGAARSYVARLNTDGTLDAGFAPNVSNYLSVVAVQPDGDIIISGGFTSVGGVTRNRMARLHADGALDAGFDPDLNSTLSTLALQADGKILIGGDFTFVGGVARNKLARLNADGTLDVAFSPNVNGSVYGVALRNDGTILVGGNFSSVSGVQYGPFVRLTNDPATQSLSAPDGGRVQWLRGGSSPEAQGVGFELSTDGGTNWTALGSGSRISGGWELTGLSLSTSGQVRARARTVGGYYNGSSGLVEQVQAYSVPPPAVATLAVTSVTSTSAILNGSVNANGLSTAVSLDYGLTDTYGTNVAGMPTSVSGGSAAAVSAALTGLSPGATYHYRVNGVSAAGGSNGTDMTFTTLTPIENWRLTCFGTTANSDDAADNADPNGNGILNLLEYALNGDPDGSTTGLSILPQAGRSAGNTLQVTFIRYLDRTDLTLIVQGADSPTGPWDSSADLASSTAGGAFALINGSATVSETGAGNTRSVTAGDLYQVTDPAHPRRFMRLVVTKP